jgi:hypothetical protein
LYSLDPLVFLPLLKLRLHDQTDRADSQQQTPRNAYLSEHVPIRYLKSSHPVDGLLPLGITMIFPLVSISIRSTSTSAACIARMMRVSSRCRKLCEPFDTDES